MPLFRRYSAAEYLVLSLVLVVGFALGEISAEQREKQHATARKNKNSKRKRGARINGENRGGGEQRGDRTNAASVEPPAHGESVDQRFSSGRQAKHDGSRRASKRKTKLSSKDSALDFFTSTAASYVPSIGGGGYQHLLLLPRSVFLASKSFVSYSDCRGRLVTLRQARAATPEGNQLRILYISCPRIGPSRMHEDWLREDYRTVVSFLERNPDLGYIFCIRSCVPTDAAGSMPSVQMHHLPLALLRADAILVLPGPANVEASATGSQAYSDLRHHMQGAWTRVELAIAAVGQGTVYIALRAPPGQVVSECKAGTNDVHEVVRRAADELRTRAAETLPRAAQPASRQAANDPSDEEIATTETEIAVEAACENWLGVDPHHLDVLDHARAAVAAAAKSGDLELLNAIRAMRPISSPLIRDLDVSLGEEQAADDRTSGLSLLLFTIFCSQPKERASYTNAFLEKASELKILYHPIAVVRSPYKERFGTPRQPQVTGAVLHGTAQDGEIVFLKGHGYGESCRASPR